jgi:hypothetical protein
LVGPVIPSATREELWGWERYYRLSVSSGSVAAYRRMNLDVDVCDVLPHWVPAAHP